MFLEDGSRVLAGDLRLAQDRKIVLNWTGEGGNEFFHDGSHYRFPSPISIGLPDPDNHVDINDAVISVVADAGRIEIGSVTKANLYRTEFEGQVCFTSDNAIKAGALFVDGIHRMIGNGTDFAIVLGSDADVNLYRDPDSEALKTDDDIKFEDDKSFFVGKDADGSLPTASESYRGKILRVEGGAGVADKLYMCMKKADDTYAWVQVASG